MTNVAAVVAPSAGADAPSLEDVQAHCRRSLAGYKIPRRLFVVDTVPRTPAGKADYGWARSVARAAS